MRDRGQFVLEEALQVSAWEWYLLVTNRTPGPWSASPSTSDTDSKLPVSVSPSSVASAGPP